MIIIKFNCLSMKQPQRYKGGFLNKQQFTQAFKKAGPLQLLVLMSFLTGNVSSGILEMPAGKAVANGHNFIYFTTDPEYYLTSWSIWKNGEGSRNFSQVQLFWTDENGVKPNYSSILGEPSTNTRYDSVQPLPNRITRVYICEDDNNPGFTTAFFFQFNDGSTAFNPTTLNMPFCDVYGGSYWLPQTGNLPGRFRGLSFKRNSNFQILQSDWSIYYDDDPCSMTIILPPTLSINPLTIWLFQPAVTSTASFSNTLVTCGTTYDLTYAPTTLPFLTYTNGSSQGTFTGISNTPQQIGTYTVNLTRVYLSPYDAETFAVPLTINVYCAYDAPICPANLSMFLDTDPQPKDIAFTQSATTQGCQIIATMTPSNLNWLQLNGNTFVGGNVRVTGATNADVGTYTVTLTNTSLGSIAKSCSFVLTVVTGADVCSTDILQPPIPSPFTDMSLIRNFDTTKTQIFTIQTNSWTSLGIACPLTCTLSGPSFVTLVTTTIFADPAMTTSADLGTQTVSVNCDSQNFPSTVANVIYNFLVTVDDCVVNSMSFQYSYSDSTYMISTGPYTISANPAIILDLACTYQVTYSLTWIKAGFSITEPAFVTWDQITNEFTNIDPKIPSDVGVYEITVEATIPQPSLGPGATKSCFETIKFTVLKDCDLTYLIDDLAITDMRIIVTGQATQNIGFDNERARFYSVPDYCGPRQVSFAINYPFLTIDQTRTTISLSTDSVTDVGTYPVEITITLVDYPAALPIIKIFDAIIECQVLSLSWTDLPASIFIVPQKTSQPYYEHFSATQLPACGEPISYILGSPIPIFVSYQDDGVEGDVIVTGAIGISNDILTLYASIGAVQISTTFNVEIATLPTQINKEYLPFIPPAIKKEEKLSQVPPKIKKKEQLAIDYWIANVDQLLTRGEVTQYDKWLIDQVINTYPINEPLLALNATGDFQNFIDTNYNAKTVNAVTEETPKQDLIDSVKHMLFDWHKGVAVKRVYDKLNPNSTNWQPNPPKPFFKIITDTGLIKISFTTDVFNLPEMKMINNGTIYLSAFDMIGSNFKRFLAQSDQVQFPVLELNVIPGIGQSHLDLTYTWNATLHESNELLIQVYFDKPDFVSMGETPDKIQVKFNDPMLFLGKNGMLIDKNTRVIEKNIRRQKGSMFNKSLQEATQTALDVAKVITFVTLGLNIFLSGALNQMWSMIETQQLIILLLMTNIKCPLNANAFFAKLREIAAFDFFNIEPATNYLLRLRSTGALNDKFEEIGLNSIYCINNLGTFSIVFLLYLMCSLTLFCFDRPCCRHIAWADMQRKKLKRKLVWSYLISMIKESSAMIAICVCINLKAIKWTSFGDYVHNFFAISFLVLIVIFPSFTIWYVSLQDPEDKKIKRRFGTLYMDLNLKNGISVLYWPLLYILRRLLLATTIIFVEQFCFQTMLIFAQITFFIIFVGYTKPWADPDEWKKQLLNESILLLVCYHMMCFTPFFPDYKKQYVVGYSVIFVVSASLVFSILQICFTSAKQLRFDIQIWLSRRRMLQQSFIIKNKVRGGQQSRHKQRSLYMRRLDNQQEEISQLVKESKDTQKATTRHIVSHSDNKKNLKKRLQADRLQADVIEGDANANNPRKFKKITFQDQMFNNSRASKHNIKAKDQNESLDQTRIVKRIDLDDLCQSSRVLPTLRKGEEWKFDGYRNRNVTVQNLSKLDHQEMTQMPDLNELSWQQEIYQFEQQAQIVFGVSILEENDNNLQAQRMKAKIR